VEILDEKELEEKGYGGIVGVGKGSEHAPRLVRLTHEPSADNEAPQVALVGKGVTFDTGGISLKPGANMWDMISDMGGSAAVVATMVAAARLDLPMKVIATIPLAENTPSSTATRPGDRKSTRLNSSHVSISYAVFCLKKKIPTDEINCAVHKA